MNWMSRRYIGRLGYGLASKGPKESYKYDLVNSLVSLIALSHDHQNHSKWPKWGHVRYTVYIPANLHQLIVLGGPGLSLGDEEYVGPVQVET